MADTRRLLEEAHKLALSHLGLLAIHDYTDGINDTRELIAHLAAALSHAAGQEVVAWCATDETGTVVEALGMNQSRRFDTPLYLHPAVARSEGEDRYRVLRDWFLREGKRSEILPSSHVKRYSEAEFDAEVDRILASSWMGGG